MRHSPEPWGLAKDDNPGKFGHRIYCSKNGANTVVGGSHPNDYDHLSLADMERIVAAVNFCRQFDTEFLQSHQMFKVSKGEDGELVAKTLADIPGFDGLVAVGMIPVVREPASAER
jgi:hypothetical protein